MRLSPFNRRVLTGTWPYEAPLYGRHDARYPYLRDECAFEVFPARSDDDVSGLVNVPRNPTKNEYQSIGFDIQQANKSTEYAKVIQSGNPPKIKWYSRDQFKNRFGYDPKNPPRPQGVSPKAWQKLAKERLRGNIDPSIQLTPDRETFLRRIARLWNGEIVCGYHLLADKCPSAKQLAADLNTEPLKRLYYNTNLGSNVFIAFHDTDWFKTETNFLKPAHLFNKRVWYDINYKTRELINGREEFPDLKGDPLEGLTHRVTVGLTKLYDELRGWKSASYYEEWGYVIDSIGKDHAGQVYAREVITDHNNDSLYKETYEKMRDLDSRGVKPIAVFDSRDTAYKVFNYWHRNGLGELPHGTFNSAYDISEGRKYIREAYQNPYYNWAVADWMTTWTLRQKIFQSDGPVPNRDQIISIDW